MERVCAQCANPVGGAIAVCPHCGAAPIVLRGDEAAGTPAAYRGHAVIDPAVLGQTQATQRQHARGTLPGYGSYAPPPYPTATDRYAKASLGRRFVALLIDGVVSALGMLPGGITMLAAAGTGRDDGASMAVGGLLLMLGVAWMLWYNFTRDGNEDGAGWGKRWMGLMVVHLPTGLPVTRGQSALRQLIYTLTSMIPLVGWLIEPIAAMATDDGRRLGDRAADTQVIEAADYVG